MGEDNKKVIDNANKEVQESISFNDVSNPVSNVQSELVSQSEIKVEPIVETNVTPATNISVNPNIETNYTPVEQTVGQNQTPTVPFEQETKVVTPINPQSSTPSINQVSDIVSTGNVELTGPNRKLVDYVPPVVNNTVDPEEEKKRKIKDILMYIIMILIIIAIILLLIKCCNENKNKNANKGIQINVTTQTTTVEATETTEVVTEATEETTTAEIATETTSTTAKSKVAYVDDSTNKNPKSSSSTTSTAKAASSGGGYTPGNTTPSKKSSSSTTSKATASSSTSTSTKKVDTYTWDAKLSNATTKMYQLYIYKNGTRLKGEQLAVFTSSGIISAGVDTGDGLNAHDDDGLLNSCPKLYLQIDAAGTKVTINPRSSCIIN